MAKRNDPGLYSRQWVQDAVCGTSLEDQPQCTEPETAGAHTVQAERSRTAERGAWSEHVRAGSLLF